MTEKLFLCVLEINFKIKFSKTVETCFTCLLSSLVTKWGGGSKLLYPKICLKGPKPQAETL